MKDNLFRFRLKQLREESGYTSQQAFAKSFGVAQSTVAGWESGAREPDFDTLLKLSSHFKAPVGYLLGSDNEKEPASLSSSELSEDKKKLLQLFDHLNAEGQEKLIDYADDLTRIDLYTPKPGKAKIG